MNGDAMQRHVMRLLLARLNQAVLPSLFRSSSPSRTPFVFTFDITHCTFIFGFVPSSSLFTFAILYNVFYRFPVFVRLLKCC